MGLLTGTCTTDWAHTNSCQYSLINYFGHDEEIGGNEGAALIAKYLEENGVKAEYVMIERAIKGLMYFMQIDNHQSSL